MAASIIALVSVLAALILFYALTIHKEVQLALYAENSRLRTAVADLIHQREDALRLVEHKDAQIRGHLRDGLIAQHDAERSKHGVPELDAQSVIGEAEAWLGQEAQA